MFNNLFDVGVGLYNAVSASNTSSPTREADENDGPRIQDLASVCVKQIHDCPGDDFSQFGIKAQILSLVVTLRTYDVTSTKASYTLEDDTGTITAFLWLNNDNKDSLQSVKVGDRCKVYGSLRTIDGLKTILILKITPIKDCVDVTTHLLKVILCRYAAEAIMKGSSSSLTIANYNPSSELANSINCIYDSVFSPIQRQIYDILKMQDSEHGLSKDYIKSNFSEGEHSDVNGALEFLASEGHIYMTFDEHHYRCTD